MHSSSNGNNVDNTMHDTRKLRYAREMNRLRNRKYRKSLRGQFTSSSTSTSDTTIIGKDFATKDNLRLITKINRCYLINRIQLLNTKLLLFLIDLDQLCGYMKHVNMNIGLSLENAVLNPRHLK
ncbi:unnamed protein product [Rotaria magnacalcarata]|uniref:Uncharacterized protein n=1 Tax=Rotaria magnacalcarata TaxID=392030 RepID=A0A816V605_9BILA|nr:unnamed protein product [Rotaria magnacalcarata]CAF1422752.1 unnamed protein product [Rotaria magnacalcarata]CAF2117233.1 unnamed protein product [Rotaria magnacalcarata]CAF4277192.1 unnamed protein product [Rotaria magnacalcarata]CAF4299654.1 unnamed protein product [Rotaria magnacalcarata]